jgi:hypothetical protein
MSAAELVDHVPVCQLLFSNAMGESHDIIVHVPGTCMCLLL